MAGFSAIANIAESLEGIIQNGLNETFPDEHVSVTPNSPKKISEEGRTTERLLSIHLYRITENADLKNAPPIPSNNGKEYQRQISSDLFFMLTPYGQDEDTIFRILGRTQQILLEHSIISGSDLVKGLEGGDDRIKISALPVPQELTTQIWQAMESPMRLALFYLVTPISIDLSTRQAGEPVKEAKIAES